MTMDSKQKCDVEIEESVALLGTKRVKYTMENDMSSSQAGVSSDVLDDKKDLGEDIDTGPCDVTGTVGLRSAESGSGKGIQGDVPASASAAEIEPLSNGETAEGRADMGSEKASTASNGEVRQHVA
ncbi:hypothetical protein SARC_11476 [Sphaeroforma arctica JP610]|uniref:Uncharacterized protein n=1 Tax=Sphaeroforma arctica JP610 TaxID=667725 RepID=A0A0L0FGV9_9EUKA|nr:hypothetical protein SARC_11476 [Sphaeroforma arctica JP610]KNC76014.1 hypothetical protein SARC_11476 [Sphaeroforma arctica JP610]|eukprot:XP_014149916.1 hypothetical protein SARC_11476 [Sphaeroforma arctica JP610]